MPFIHVTRLTDKIRVDLNSSHIVAYHADTIKGTNILCLDGVTIHAEEAPRQIRSFLMQAEGVLPSKGNAKALA